MKRLSPRDEPARLRARRWDAIVLGGSLPGLVTATRLALAKKRVLLVEEETAARHPPSLRDPFVVPHANGGAVDQCLRALGLPLIDRRRLVTDEVGLQVLLPGVRADVGNAARTADELVAWGLAKPDTATAWIGAWVAASEADATALAHDALVRSGRGLGLGRRRGHETPGPEPEPESPLGAWLDTLQVALTHDGSRPAARAVGAVLEGVALFGSAAESLNGLLRQRFQALHGEIRLVSQRFSLVNLDGSAAIRPGHGAELWVARAMVLNTPIHPLRHQLREAGGDPEFLPEPRVRGRRIGVCFDTERDQIPEGMARRLVDAGAAGDAPVRIGWNPSRSGARAEVFASALAPLGDAGAAAALEDELGTRIRTLLPFAGERLHPREAADRPLWDDDAVVEGGLSGQSWPAEVAIRLVSRPLVYWLPRGAVASLGTEGECLLGWRAGDAILGDLG